MPGAQLLPRLQRGRQQHGVDCRGEGYRVITSQGCRVIPIEVLGVVGAVVAGLGLQGVVHWLWLEALLLVLLGAGEILLVVEREMVLLLWWILLLLW